MNKLNCYSIDYFNYVMKHNGIKHDGSNLPDNVAIISICEPEDNRGTGYPDRWFTIDNEVIINLDFDDIDGDAWYWEDYYRTEPDKFIIYKGQVLKPITDKQADELVKFIVNNLDKNFFIHCFAGVSRSKAITKFIFDTFQDYSKDDCEEWDEPEIPNMFVYKKLKEAYKRWQQVQ